MSSGTFLSFFFFPKEITPMREIKRKQLIISIRTTSKINYLLRSLNKNIINPAGQALL